MPTIVVILAVVAVALICVGVWFHGRKSKGELSLAAKVKANAEHDAAAQVQAAKDAATASLKASQDRVVKEVQDVSGVTNLSDYLNGRR